MWKQSYIGCLCTCIILYNEAQTFNWWKNRSCYHHWLSTDTFLKIIIHWMCIKCLQVNENCLHMLKSILAARCVKTVVYVNILWLRSNETMSKSVWISKAMFWGCMVRTGGQWDKPCVCWGSDPDNHFYINRPAGSLRFTGFCWFFCWFV